MKHVLRIGLIGDFDAQILAHQAIPRALELAGSGHEVHGEWLATDAIGSDATLRRFDGLWCVPGSPYRNADNALRAIRFAREQKRPILGSCGGFQHALIEYARNVLGWHDAEHAETAPGGARTVITPLLCALVEARGSLRFTVGSKLAMAYGAVRAALRGAAPPIVAAFIAAAAG